MTQRTPIKRGPPPRNKRPGKPRRSSRVLDEPYLDWLRKLPCWSCFRPIYEVCDSSWWEDGCSEAAHIGRSGDARGMSQKYGDDTAIPLCANCHKHGPLSIHKIGPVAFFGVRETSRDVVINIFRQFYLESL